MTPYVSNALGSYQSNAYTIANRNEASEQNEKTSSESSSSSSGKGSATDPVVQQKVSDLMAELSKSGFSKLSFKDIKAQREAIEKQFDKEVREELKALGVDTDKKFQLIYDESSGKIVVGNDHPDKKVIESYFAANPERVKQFNVILDMQQVEELAQNRLEPQQFRAKITQQSMAFWLNQNAQSDMFSGIRGIMFDIENSYMRSLNMRV